MCKNLHHKVFDYVPTTNGHHEGPRSLNLTTLDFLVGIHIKIKFAPPANVDNNGKLREESLMSLKDCEEQGWWDRSWLENQIEQYNMCEEDMPLKEAVDVIYNIYAIIII